MASEPVSAPVLYVSREGDLAPPSSFRRATERELLEWAKDVFRHHVVAALREARDAARCAGGTKRSRIELSLCEQAIDYAAKKMGVATDETEGETKP